MARMRRSGCAIVALLLVVATGCREEAVDAGFWFDPVAFASPRLGGALAPADIAHIEQIARAEMAHAFDGLRISFSDRRSARYRVRVVQEVRDPRFRRPVESAGESRAVAGFGGAGRVSFTFVVSGALAYAPSGADRDAIIAGIGRGIGRTAVHELTHQLLPTAPIHDSRDVQSYEYRSAARHEQYYGPMRWDLARPLLEKRLGLSSLSREQTDASIDH